MNVFAETMVCTPITFSSSIISVYFLMARPFPMGYLLLEYVFRNAPCLNMKLCLIEVCRDWISPQLCLVTYKTGLPEAVLWSNPLIWDVLVNTLCWSPLCPPDPLWINNWYWYGVICLCKSFSHSSLFSWFFGCPGENI